ncbi:ribose import ATP-binding protein RbsA 2 [Synergistales bacterium]|nr:ribose import ATP-binding protein RbsA 2 [Synergistales bacterium]
MALLETSEISKRFPGVLALDRFNIAFDAGEVHALVGENGAGKSTLVKILSGLYAPTSGKLLWEGRPIKFRAPRAAVSRVGVVHQERELVPHFTGCENLFLGLEFTRLGFLKKREMEKRAQEFLERYKMNVDLSVPALLLSSGQQEMLSILKVLFRDPRVVIFDEPTAPLSVAECEILFSLIQDLKEDGRAILYISHQLSEVLRIADRVTVMRNGSKIDTLPNKNISEDTLIHLMIAKDLDNQYPKVRTIVGGEIFRAENYSVPKRTGKSVKDATFSIRTGEIVGFAGLVGAGRTELAKGVFGSLGGTSGALFLSGEAFRAKSPRDAIERGVVMIPENRREEGVIADMDVASNLIFPNLKPYAALGFINAKKANAAVKDITERYNIRAFGPSQIVKTLSGGNQQKVSVGKWGLSKAKLWIFDEPTRGIDVDAKTEIYSIMGRMAALGAGVWFISSELRELTAVSDRLYVMRDGRIVAEYSPPYKREKILDSMMRG